VVQEIGAGCIEDTVLRLPDAFAAVNEGAAFAGIDQPNIADAKFQIIVDSLLHFSMRSLWKSISIHKKEVP